MGKKRKQKHATIQQTHERPVTTTLCAQKGCKFYGKEPQQGVCHTDEGLVVEWAKIDAHEKELLEEMRTMKKREGKDYVRALEAHYVSAMMNWQITLDECIRLRRDLALAKVS